MRPTRNLTRPPTSASYERGNPATNRRTSATVTIGELYVSPAAARPSRRRQLAQESLWAVRRLDAQVQLPLAG